MKKNIYIVPEMSWIKSFISKEVSSNSSRAITFSFRLISLRKL